MTNDLALALAMAGGYAAVALAAIGSATGCGIAGQAAVAAWKRCYAQNKPAPFLLVALAGTPLSQTIYGMILMMLIKGGIAKAVADSCSSLAIFYLVMGVVAGFGFMFSSIYQGKAAAAGCDAFGETNKGFTNYLTIVGIVETVALFVLVFGIIVINVRL
ncbi:MAG: V-type ATP synthase subunit K [Lentisphaerae bacterium]|nr:V-type ATP synthase subunit K [Lentisphaerota bacterium]